MIKRFIIAFVLLVLVAGGLIGFNLFRDKAIQDFFAHMPVNPATVSTVTVEPGTWTPAIDTIGTVNASRGVDLTVETSGIVESIEFHANQRVEQGDTLVQLGDAIEAADLQAAKTQAALDQQSLQRAIDLNSKGVGTTANLDAAQAAASASAAQVEKLEAQLRQKKLRAPFAGTIGIPRIDVGQYMTPGTKVATLQDLDTLRADFSVPEQRIGELRIGQAVRFGVTSDDLPFTGSITGIDPKVDASSRLVSIRAAIDNPDGKLTPGPVRPGADRASGRERRHHPASDRSRDQPLRRLRLCGPPDRAAAGRRAAGSGGTRVRRPGGEPARPPPAAPSLSAVQVFVKLGRRAQGRVEIREGLAAGDEVVSAGQNRLFNGMPVVVDNTVTPAGAAGADGSPVMSKLFIQRPVLSTVFAALILLLGFQGLFNLSIREYPEVEETVITITTVYPGASADLIQGFITAPISAAVATTENVNYITSQSQPLGEHRDRQHAARVQSRRGAHRGISPRSSRSRASSPPTPRTRPSSRARASSSRSCTWRCRTPT